MYKYNAKVIHVIDGDTFEAEIDLGFHIKIKQTIRMNGIDTFELSSNDERKKALANEAKDYVIDKIWDKDVILETVKSSDKYGRFLATVFYKDDLGCIQELNSELINAGLAIKYDGGKKE